MGFGDADGLVRATLHLHCSTNINARIPAYCTNTMFYILFYGGLIRVWNVRYTEVRM